ncbi:unnamed protein product, partial [Ectocarpus fasciculatus]
PFIRLQIAANTVATRHCQTPAVLRCKARTLALCKASKLEGKNEKKLHTSLTIFKCSQGSIYIRCRCVARPDQKRRQRVAHSNDTVYCSAIPRSRRVHPGFPKERDTECRPAYSFNPHTPL